MPPAASPNSKTSTAGGAGGGGHKGKSKDGSSRLNSVKYPRMTCEDLNDGSILPPSAMLAPPEEADSGPGAVVQAPAIVEFLNMSDFTHNVDSIVPVHEPIFQPSPTEIVFRSFEPHTKYDIRLSLRNNDNVGRRVKIQAVQSPHFSLKRNVGEERSGDKVAPGMEVSYTVSFTPETKMDYSYDLIAVTEREKFVIPIRAVGPRGRFTFPDEFDFGDCSVRSESSKTLLVRNIGDTQASFTCHSEEPFFFSPQTVVLGVEEAVQVTVSFFPEKLKEYEQYATITYSSGEEVAMQIRGSGCEIGTGIEPGVLVMDPTYVTLFSQKTVKIYNNSEEMVRFDVRALGSEVEEAALRETLVGELHDTLPHGTSAAVVEHREDQIADMPLHFQDDAFKIEPVCGEVWPGQTKDLLVTFAPSEAIDHTVFAHVELAGRETRQQLQLQGTGVGAQLFLSHTVLSVGEVIIRSENEYEFFLENQGDIEAPFEYVPQDTMFGPRFTFEPSQGVAAAGQKIKVKVIFYPKTLGDFDEEFEWYVRGSPKPLVISFRGKVVCPAFHTDSDGLDYGRVSVGFLQTRNFHIFNTSEVPFRFNLRVPGDGSMLDREFDCIPATGVVLPGGKHPVRVDFVPAQVRLYDLHVSVDLEGVGEGLLQLPIAAQGVVPDIVASSNRIDFGQAYLHHAHTKYVELTNNSDLPAKFEVLPQAESLLSVGILAVDVTKGTVPAKSNLLLTIQLTAERQGRIEIPLRIFISGMQGPPMEVWIGAEGIGPQLKASPNDLVNWGGIPALEAHQKIISIKNVGLIPAHLRSVVLKRNSVFTVPETHEDVELEAGQSVEIPVVAKLNDLQTFKDTLVVAVHEGQDMRFTLKATGTGTTLWCDHSLADVHLGSQFSQRQCESSFVIVNRGIKQQTLTWTNTSTPINAAELSKKPDANKTPPQPQHVFSVVPDKCTLEPGQNCRFTVQGLSSKIGTITEGLQGKVMLDRQQMVAFETNVTADFITPLLQFAAPSVNFEWTQQPGEISAPISQTLSFKNVSDLALHTFFKATPPFALDVEEVALQPGEGATANISFDPGWKGDKTSTVAQSKLAISYKEHPQKDFLPLEGVVVYPNLDISSSSVNFGAVLSNTQTSQHITLTNSQSIPVEYSWTFAVEEGTFEDMNVNDVFDIVPVRGTLQPGEVQDTEVHFFAHDGLNFECTAVAEVTDGPEYDVAVTGAGQAISFKVDKPILDFQDLPYDKFASMELLVTNTSRVKYDYSFDCTTVQWPSVVKCEPSSGVMREGEKLKVQVLLYPGVPDDISSSFFLRCSHLEPMEIKVNAKGIFPQLVLSLPRSDADLHQQRLAPVLSALKDKGESIPEGLDAEYKARAATPVVSSASRAQTAATSVPGSRAKSRGGSKRLQAFIRDAEAEVDRLSMCSHIHAEVGRKLDQEENSRPRRRPASTVATLEVDEQEYFERLGEAMPAVVESDEQEAPSSPEAQSSDSTADAEQDASEQVQNAGSEEVNGNTSPSQDQPQHEEQPKESESQSGEIQETQPVQEDSDTSPEPAISSAPALQADTDVADPVAEADPDDASVAESVAPWQPFSRLEPAVDMSGYVAARYMCDFGFVVKGTSRKRNFLLTNAGPVPLSIEINKKVKALLATQGFSLEPEKLQKMPGAPQYETQDFSVVFNSGKVDRSEGEIIVTLPLNIKQGPIVEVLLRAYVTVPDVKISAESLDFGSVMCGQAQELCFQLTNNKLIPCDWSLTEPVEGVKKAVQFVAVPTVGQLQPGESCNVIVRFSPSGSKLHSAKMGYKIAQNPSKRAIKLKAQGLEPHVRFDPPLALLDAVRPCKDTTTKTIKLVNDSDEALQVACLELDEEIFEEQTFVSVLEGFGKDGTLLLPHRAAGEPLPSSVKEWIQRKTMWNKHAELEAAAAAKAAEEQAEGQVGTSDDVQDPGENADQDVTQEPAPADQTVGEIVDATGPTLSGQYFLVHAMPSIGSDGIADALCTKYSVPSVSIDECIEAAVQPQPVSNPPDDQASQDVEQPDGDAGEAENAEPVMQISALGAALQSAFQAAALAAAAPAADPKAKKGKAPEPSEDDLETVEYGPTKIAILKDSDLDDGCKSALADVVRDYISREKFGRGCVFTGCTSKISTDSAGQLKSVLAALDKGGRLSLVRGNKVEPAADEPRTEDQASTTGEESQAEGQSEDASSHQPAEEEDPAAAEARAALEAADAAWLAQAEGIEAVLEAAIGRVSPEGGVDFAGLPEIDVAPDLPATPSEDSENAEDSAGDQEGEQSDNDASDQDEQLACVCSDSRVTVGGEVSISEQIDELVESQSLADPAPLPGERARLRVRGPVMRSIFYRTAERDRCDVLPEFSLSTVTYQAVVNEGEQEEPSESTADDEVEHQEPKMQAVFNKQSRWVVPAHGQVELQVSFNSESIGKFSSSLHFEIIGAPPRLRNIQLPLSGTCAHPAISSDHRSIFLHKVRQRPDSGIVSKKYVISASEFDFGPLLLGRKGEDDPRCGDNQATFRISNIGLFDMHASFMLEEENSAFIIEPQEVSLPVDEVAEIQVSCFPTEEGNVNAKLMCVVTDNPSPVVLPMVAEGFKPKIDIDGLNEAGELQFERLRARLTDNMTLTLTNPTKLPVKWQIGDAEDMEQFSLSVTEGILPPLQSTSVMVTFSSDEPVDASKTVKLLVSDVNDEFGTAQETPIPIKAEAYEVDTVVTFPTGRALNESQSDWLLDFGTVRVVDQPKQSMELENKGKYDVGFKLNVRKAATAKLFDFSEAEGSLAPGEKKTVEITFTELEKEVSLVENNDIRVQISDGNNGEVTVTLPIKVSIRSLFSNYKVLPAKGINFGALVYGTTKERTLDIHNQGEFEFNYKLIDFEADVPENEPAADPKAKGKGAPAAGTDLQLGPFKISPSSGSIAPGTCATVKISFAAQGSEVHLRRMGVVVSECAPHVGEKGELYELSGESCVPGIVTQDWHSIFEEQQVFRAGDSGVSQLEAAFMLDERTFTFGSATCGQQVEQRFKIVNPCKVPCTVDFSVKPYKSSASAAGGKGGGGGSTPRSDGSAFEVQPSKLVIPTHEHRYVTLFFNPSSLDTMSGMFEALVDGGTDDKTKLLSFALRGTGILPRITVAEPSVLNANGHPEIDFGQLLVGRTVTRRVVLRNEGSIPAQIRVDSMASAPPSIQFTGRGHQGRLAPGDSQDFEMSFTPREEGDASAEIKITVQQNPYEDTVLSVKGTGFVQDISFENLPAPPSSLEGPSHDVLNVGGTPIGVPKEVQFRMVNCTSKTYRFEWPEDSPLQISPRVGHLLPHATKDHTATFLAADKVTLEGQPIAASCSVITQKNDDVTDWDDRVRNVRWVPIEDEDGESGEAESSVVAAARRRKGGTKKIVESAAEPEYDVEEGSNSEAPLRVYANSDVLQYELSAAEATLKPTMMFQTRSHTFTLKNTSAIPMQYQWALVKVDGHQDPAWPADETDPDAIVPKDPFSMSPTSGELEAGESVNVSMQFSPEEAGMYHRMLHASIPHLDVRPLPKEDSGDEPPPDPKAKGKGAPAAPEPLPEPQEQPCVSISARSVRPVCHFELDPSDWLTGGRRPADLPGPGGEAVPVDPSTRVVEFQSLGTRVRNTRRFNVVNPTNVSYQYVWENMDGSGAAALVQGRTFRCHQRRGVVLAGKKAEMVFDFTPEEDKVLESFWMFRIPEHGINVPFLLLGNVKEPLVMLDRPAVNFNALLLSGTAHQVVNIVNKEHLPFAFNIDPSSLGVENGSPAVTIQPMSGSVSPGSEMPLRVTFRPAEEKHYNFNVGINVRTKATKLNLNVKGEGFAVHATVAIEDANEGSSVLVPGQAGLVDFGTVYLQDKKVKSLSVTNGGKFPLDFSFTKVSSRHLTISPESAVVPKGERVEVLLAFHPTIETSLSNLQSVLALTNGPRYPISFGGSGRRPGLRLSTQSVNFGACFLHQHGLQPRREIITVANEDRQDIAFDVLFENKTHLEVDATPTILSPGDVAEIAVTFLPRQIGDLNENIVVEVNGMYRLNVDVTGFGEARRIEPADAASANVDFAAVNVGAVTKRHMRLVNRSRVHAEVSMATTKAALADAGVLLSPSEFSLRPKGTVDLEFAYAPKARQQPFAVDVIGNVGGVDVSIGTVTGQATGLETKLETDMIFFGAVVARSRTVRRVVLENVGDVGARFSWASDRFAPDFTVNPSEGFVSAHDEVTFEITFHPETTSPDIRYEDLPLSIDGMPTHGITLTGMCVDQEPSQDPISFDVPVRQEMQKEVPAINNPTDTMWVVKPVFDNDFWSGPEVLEIPAGKSAALSVTFRPLAMATGEEPHQGSVFFPLPNGSAVLYKLQGTAGAPLKEGKVENTCRAKQPSSVAISVKNWLRSPQRFKVEVNLDGSTDATSLKAPEYIDVPAMQERECRLKFYSFVEGSFSGMVKFINESSGEYQEFDVQQSVTKPDVFARADLKTVVRQAVSTTFLIDNPLDKEVVLNVSSDNGDILVDNNLALQPRSASNLVCRYRPLLAGEGSASIKASSQELGEFVFEVTLKASAAGAEKSLHFNSPLGQADSRSFRFMHLHSDKADYKVTVEGSDFVVDQASVAAPPGGSDGEEVSVDVRFEPSKLGDSEGRLILTSATAGEYTCMLHGETEAPRPQGPVEVKAAGATINFKNAFSEAVSFKATVDNPAFTVSSKGGDSIGPRATAQYAVAYKATAPGVAANAKLTIRGGGCSWVYYLKGTS